MLKDLLESLPPCRVLPISGPCAAIDLSADGPHRDAEITDAYIQNLMDASGAKFLAGGYLEKRSLYRRSDLFGLDRNIHIGLDLWAPAGTPVLAPIDGTVHSFDYNAGIGNYGPTVILQHKFDGLTFFTLYGHLSAESLEDLELGDLIVAGTEFSQLGTRQENGDYAPHLHLQVIADMDGRTGDYPGVCSAQDLPFFMQNCPDPNLLLKLDCK